MIMLTEGVTAAQLRKDIMELKWCRMKRRGPSRPHRGHVFIYGNTQPICVCKTSEKLSATKMTNLLLWSTLRCYLLHVNFPRRNGDRATGLAPDGRHPEGTGDPSGGDPSDFQTSSRRASRRGTPPVAVLRPADFGEGDVRPRRRWLLYRLTLFLSV